VPDNTGAYIPPTIDETIPYLLSKEGPNAHLFKFQTTRRVNYAEQIVFRNVVRQHQASLEQSKQSYLGYLRSQRRPVLRSNSRGGRKAAD
jgi:hypothetical protein